MKKILTLLLLPFFLNVANAQKADSTKLVQKISGGAIVASVASTIFSNSKTPFTVGYNLLTNVTVVTPKTYHSVLYGFGNNTIRSLNGYFLPKDCDIYLLYIHPLGVRQHYLGFGFEKMLKAGDARFFLFTEVGTDFKGTESMSLGVLMSLQNLIWKRK